jgi:hypothetical protein
MLKGNLSSRPFYNDRLVSIALVAVALLTLALTVFNASKILSLSRQRNALKSRIARDAGEAQRIERGAVALQRSVDRQTLSGLAYSTEEANELIDERAFSWTGFFSYIEKTMPNDLRLVGVAPRIEKGNIRVTMTVVGKRPDDVEAFADALQGTGAFYDVIPKTVERNEDDNTYRADIVSFYLPSGSPPKAVPAKSTAGGRGRQ